MNVVNSSNNLNRIFERENKGNTASFTRLNQISPSDIQRLGLVAEYKGHKGCVNCLEWNKSGTLLASGSDDFNIIVWSKNCERNIYHFLKTSHQGNIFSIKFLPNSNDNIIVSGAADKKVCLYDLNTCQSNYDHVYGPIYKQSGLYGRYPCVSDHMQNNLFNYGNGNSNYHHQLIRTFSCHTGRVKRLAVSEQEPTIIWSIGEDGVVMQYDTRLPSCVNHKNDCASVSGSNTDATSEAENILFSAPTINVHYCPSTLINLNASLVWGKDLSKNKSSSSNYATSSSNFIEGKSLTINPVRPEQIAIGCNDPYVRVYDRRYICRKAGAFTPLVQHSPTPLTSVYEGDIPYHCCRYFVPGHIPYKLKAYRRVYRALACTYVTYSPDGTELLVNLGGEQIYLYDATFCFLPKPLKRFPLLTPEHMNRLASDENYGQELSYPDTNNINLDIAMPSLMGEALTMSQNKLKFFKRNLAANKNGLKIKCPPPTFSSDSEDSPKNIANDRSEKLDLEAYKKLFANPYGRYPKNKLQTINELLGVSNLYSTLVNNKTQSINKIDGSKISQNRPTKRENKGDIQSDKLSKDSTSELKTTNINDSSTDIIPAHVLALKALANHAFKQNKFHSAINSYNKAIVTLLKYANSKPSVFHKQQTDANNHITSNNENLNDDNVVFFTDKLFKNQEEGNKLFYDEWCLKFKQAIAILYCNRALALIKRNWDGDSYAALLDSFNALRYDENNIKARFRFIKCLLEFDKCEECRLCLNTFCSKFGIELRRTNNDNTNTNDNKLLHSASSIDTALVSALRMLDNQILDREKRLKPLPLANQDICSDNNNSNSNIPKKSTYAQEMENIMKSLAREKKIKRSHQGVSSISASDRDLMALRDETYNFTLAKPDTKLSQPNSNDNNNDINTNNHIIDKNQNDFTDKNENNNHPPNVNAARKKQINDFNRKTDVHNGAESAKAHYRFKERIWKFDARDYSKVFCGHCNTTTDIKEANFYGSDGQYIIAGSDDGFFFVWDKATTNICKILLGDKAIVNCLQPHPVDCSLATSGIDPHIRIWSPVAIEWPPAKEDKDAFTSESVRTYDLRDVMMDSEANNSDYDNDVEFYYSTSTLNMEPSIRANRRQFHAALRQGSSAVTNYSAFLSHLNTNTSSNSTTNTPHNDTTRISSLTSDMSVEEATALSNQRRMQADPIELMLMSMGYHLTSNHNHGTENNRNTTNNSNNTVNSGSASINRANRRSTENMNSNSIPRTEHVINQESGPNNTSPQNSGENAGREEVTNNTMNYENIGEGEDPQSDSRSSDTSHSTCTELEEIRNVMESVYNEEVMDAENDYDISNDYHESRPFDDSDSNESGEGRGTIYDSATVQCRTN